MMPIVIRLVMSVVSLLSLCVQGVVSPGAVSTDGPCPVVVVGWPISAFSISGITFVNADYVAMVGLFPHEYGHALQEREIGTVQYLTTVAAPSISANVVGVVKLLLTQSYSSPVAYHRLPWEADADVRGIPSTDTWGNWEEDR